jgi:hypothetical protein
MAELAVTDGMPPPGDLPAGECILTSVYDDEGAVGRATGVRIDRADPRILISAELLVESFIAPAPGVSLNTGMVREGPNGTPFWEGAVLKIEGVNRTVIYRIGEYAPRVRGYIGEWPD